MIDGDLGVCSFLGPLHEHGFNRSVKLKNSIPTPAFLCEADTVRTIMVCLFHQMIRTYFTFCNPLLSHFVFYTQWYVFNKKIDVLNVEVFFPNHCIFWPPVQRGWKWRFIWNIIEEKEEVLAW
jgi:hypothetical protein